jgi:hypothetical protein
MNMFSINNSVWRSFSEGFKGLNQRFLKTWSLQKLNFRAGNPLTRGMDLGTEFTIRAFLWRSFTRPDTDATWSGITA